MANLEFPFIVIESIFLNSKILKEIFESPIVKIKYYIGSDFNIDGSGFLFQGINNSTISVECTSKYMTNFMKSYFFKILNINGLHITENIGIEINIYKNSNNNTTIIEFSIGGEYNNNDYTKWVRDKLLELKIKKYFEYISNRIENYILNENNISNIRFTKMYHSILINVNYKIACKYSKDFNNIARAIGADKFWDIKKNNLTFSVNMKNGVSVDYKIYKEFENVDESKSLIYHKYKDGRPALNEWTKFDFFNIGKDICLLIHETKIPENINSFIYITINDFTIYLLKKIKIFIESENKK
jgi:hypothetical protein